MALGRITPDTTSAEVPSQGQPAGVMTVGLWPVPRATTPVEARDFIADILERDLRGPLDEREQLSERPSSRYLTGMLAPFGTEIDAAADEDQPATDDGEPSDAGAPVSHSLYPSSIGLAVLVAAETHELEVRAGWGAYVRRSIEVDGKRRVLWAREPHVRGEDGSLQIRMAENRGVLRLTEDGVTVEWISRRAEQGFSVSVFLVNRRMSRQRPVSDEVWMFQAWLELRGARGSRPFLARPDPLRGLADPELRSFELLYRHRPVFALGHGSAAQWDAVEVSERSAGRAGIVATAVIPRHEVELVQPTSVDRVELGMDRLAESADNGTISAELGPLVEGYEAWISRQEARLGSLAPDFVGIASEHLRRCRAVAGRIRDGINLLESDVDARRAFAFANRAMLIQRSRSDWLALPVDQRPDQPTLTESWRPFQVAFILMNLRGLVDPAHSDRRVADLLWFPTGGGKTEAYLGLAAFVMALRRIRGTVDGRRGDAGVTILMRYTLRLLTAQQFQRAATLICACEEIRRGDPASWGDRRFSLGLWVGQGVTPNTFEQSDRIITQLIAGGQPEGGTTPIQLVSCPWCGSALGARDYRPDRLARRTRLLCPSSHCAFSAGAGGLPVVVVDEEVYAECPTFLLGTVDKFARLPWVGPARTLFGSSVVECDVHGFYGLAEYHPRHRGQGAAVARPTAPLLPPHLIIQDELHLITGPLGTLVGLYETAVDALCSYEGARGRVRPKVVASTATIRRAEAQVRRLFDRDLQVFPPPGLDAADSYFARTATVEPGRLYLGLYAPGKSLKTTQVRVLAALLAAAGAVAGRDSEAADPYSTLVAYYTTLRELGSAVRLVEDDVPSRLVLFARSGLADRRVQTWRELTGRQESSLIPVVLAELGRNCWRDGAPCVDVLLASSMLSVGVDIPRLSLMVMNGQPKTTAEYIQATSRIGRRHPGLVVTIYNWARPRDISHYEAFRPYHQALYRHVEGVTVTPFSSRARDRALHAVLVALLRHAVADLAPDAGAGRLSLSSPEVVSASGAILARTKQVAPDVAATVGAQVRALLEAWADRAHGLVYRGEDGPHPADRVLLRPAEDQDGGLWPTMNSMRGVEAAADVIRIE